MAGEILYTHIATDNLPSLLVGSIHDGSLKARLSKTKAQNRSRCKTLFLEYSKIELDTLSTDLYIDETPLVDPFEPYTKGQAWLSSDAGVEYCRQEIIRIQGALDIIEDQGGFKAIFPNLKKFALCSLLDTHHKLWNDYEEFRSIRGQEIGHDTTFPNPDEFKHVFIRNTTIQHICQVVNGGPLSLNAFSANLQAPKL